MPLHDRDRIPQRLLLMRDTTMASLGVLAC